MINFADIHDQWQQAFGQDLNLVTPHHAEKPITIFDSPLPPDHYSLTLFPENFNPEHWSKIEVVLVGCMDKRQAAKLYQAVLDLGYQPAEVASFFVAGGVVQYGQERRQALKEGLTFIAQSALELKKVIATDHSHRCGAVHFWAGVGLGKLHPKFGTEPGGPQEKDWMRSLIAEGAQNLVLPALREANSRASVETWLVSSPGDQISIEKFDFTQAQPKSVSNLLA